MTQFALEFRKLDKWERRKLRQNTMRQIKKFTLPGCARLFFDRQVATEGIRVIKTVQETTP